jgi:chorismate mutase / prephenate dehydratase
LTATDPILDKAIAKIDHDILELLHERCRLLADSQEKLIAAGGLASHIRASSQAAVQGSPQGLASRVLPLLAGMTYQASVQAVKIAYLGPEYSYSYSAARKQFGEVGLQAVPSIRTVFDEIERSHSQFGVVPIENSTDGRIVDTLTMFIQKAVKICGEVYLPIHHNLLAKCERSQIQEVYSKPQALSQCRNWLANHLPQARWVEVASTAAAAQIASTTPHAAAVASKDAAIAWELDVVAQDIEDNPDNVTRFAVIGQDSPAPTGRDKTSIMLQVPHKPGALADAMLVFRDRGLNLTWIESFPIPGAQNEYFFFIELDGHRDQPTVSDAIQVLQSQSMRVNVLGSYPKGTLP